MLHCLPSELDDVPAIEIMEIAAWFSIREREREDGHRTSAIDKAAREYQEELAKGEAGPAVLGRKPGSLVHHPQER